MDEEFIALIGIVSLFIGLPWLIFHYITKWKTAKVLTNDDEKLLDDLYEAARRLDERRCYIGRLMKAENHDWNRNACLPDRETASGQRLLEQSDALEQPLGRSRRKAK